jgi:ABC-type antimicrobial peptide transport system permease subunit
MRAVREWISRLLGTLGRRRDDRDLREELELHLALAAEDAKCRDHSPDQSAPTVQREAGSMGRTIYNVRTMTVGLVAAIGIMGLRLSIVGLYGLVAYSASRRTREVGIRMAIGADRKAVLWMVPRQGLLLAMAGLALGSLFRMGIGRALAAAYLPARRASTINPISALRCE